MGVIDLRNEQKGLNSTKHPVTRSHKWMAACVARRSKMYYRCIVTVYIVMYQFSTARLTNVKKSLAMHGYYKVNYQEKKSSNH